MEYGASGVADPVPRTCLTDSRARTDGEATFVVVGAILCLEPVRRARDDGSEFSAARLRALRASEPDYENHVRSALGVRQHVGTTVQVPFQPGRSFPAPGWAGSDARTIRGVRLSGDRLPGGSRLAASAGRTTRRSELHGRPPSARSAGAGTILAHADGVKGPHVGDRKIHERGQAQWLRA